MIKIKPLSNFPGHIPSLADLWIQNIGSKHFPNVTRDEVESRLRNSMNEKILPMTFVAMDGGTVVGMASLTSDPILPGMSVTPWISNVCVDPGYQRRGIGKLLVNTMKSEAFRLGFKSLWRMAFDQEAGDWYINMGWEKTESRNIDHHKVDIIKVELSHTNLL